MSRKDYEILARVLGNFMAPYIGEEYAFVRRTLYEPLIAELAKDNSAFDRERFDRAVLAAMVTPS